MHLRSFFVALAAAMCLGNTLFAADLATPPLAPLATPAWPHQTVQRQPDPRVRFGVLPNGMRYALLHNDTPQDGVSMRLRIGAGSLQESDSEQGLAHVLEHMAFRGSAHLADGDVVRLLERQGLRFGADTNAYTSFDQTVYTFDFPRANAESLQTGFTLLREIGEHLTLSQELLDVERKVVLAEERMRDTPAQRASKASTTATLAGSRIPQRWPIGLTSVIANASSTQLRRYYTDNYRPDNATLIVVGAIDVEAVASQIQLAFGDWRAHGYQAPVALGSVQLQRPAQEMAQTYAEPGAPESLTLTWLYPWQAQAPTEAAERDEVLTQLALEVLNTRLSERGLQAGSPYLSAAAYYQSDVFHLARSTSLSISAPSAHWADALQTVVQLQKQLLLEGVRPDELQRVRTDWRTTLQKLVDQSATRSSSSLANELLQSVHTNTVFTSAAQDQALSEEFLGQFTTEQLTAMLNERLRSLFAAQPLGFLSSNTAATDRSTLASALTGAWQQAVTASSTATAKTETNTAWPFADWSHLGAPGQVVSQRTDAELGARTVVFDNGTRLVLKRTAFEKDNVQVRISFGRGRAGMSTAQADALWALPYVTLGGTERMGVADLQRWTQTQGIPLSIDGLAAGNQSFSLFGHVAPTHLREQLELMTAALREPGWRPELFDKLAQMGPIVAQQLPSNGGSVFMREVDRVLNGDDPRLANTPTDAQLRSPLSATTLRPLLASAQQEVLDIVLVGDLDPDSAIALVAQTLAAGRWQAATPPTSPSPLKAQPLPVSSSPYRVQHQGRADLGYIGLLWPLQGPGSISAPDFPHWEATVRLTAALLRARLTDTVRENMGLSYSPQTGSESEPGQAYFMSYVESQPQHFAAYQQTVLRELERMAQGEISADALDRARRPLLERIAKAQENNGYWVGTLMRVLRQSAYRSVALQQAQQLQAVTVADVQAFIRAQLPTGQARVVQATP